MSSQLSNVGTHRPLNSMRGQFFTSRPGKKTSLYKLRSILTPFTSPFARHSIQQKIFQILKGIYVHWTFSTFKRKDLLSLLMLSSIKPSPTNRDAKWGMKLFSKIKQVNSDHILEKLWRISDLQNLFITCILFILEFSMFIRYYCCT